MALPRLRIASARRAGFTLIEVVVVMLIFGVVIAMASVITRGIVGAQKRSLTATRIAGIETALIQFVQQQKRLPCPADGTLASSANNAGTEMIAGGVCSGNQRNGVVPWRALGLTETDATDAWDRRLTYRVGPSLALASGMDMSWCDPAGGEVPLAPAVGRACTPGCTSTTLTACTPPSAFLPGKGLSVRNVPPPPPPPPPPQQVLMDPTAVPHTGAAYVVISHGESGGGGYLNTGTLFANAAGDGDEEMKNYASLPYDPVATYYLDNALIETPVPFHFDDLVLRPSLLAVINKAGLGPRAH